MLVSRGYWADDSGPSCGKRGVVMSATDENAFWRERAWPGYVSWGNGWQMPWKAKRKNMSLDDLNIQYLVLPPSTVTIYSHVVYILDILFWPQFVVSLQFIWAFPLCLLHYSLLSHVMLCHVCSTIHTLFQTCISCNPDNQSHIPFLSYLEP